MCGIAGIALRDRQAKVSEHLLRKMADTITYRGPDDDGYYINRHVGLGFRRLSIIDLSTGHQPLCNEDGSVWIVFNGEIYNFREIRARLITRGHKFRTQTDTEALVHLYEEYGSQCVEHLRGMYAFAIYDERTDKLFLARDRFGKKPLYFTRTPDRFVFGSELKVVLASGELSKDLNPAAVSAYFTYGYIPGNETIFKGIEKCPPAHYMEYDCANGSLRIQKYWSPKFDPDYSLSEAEWVERVNAKLDEAVRIRLVSDVPLGAFLSGGIDSSAVVAMMASHCDQPVKTFTIGFKEQEYNELPYAAEVVRRYGTEHHEQILEPESVDLLPRLVRSFDEPFSDASSIPTYYVSKFAREHVTVCLSGDGGDELFAGYDDYQKQLGIYRFNRTPAWLNSAVWGTVHRLWPDALPGKGLTYFLSHSRHTSAAYYSVFTIIDRKKLFAPYLRDRTRELSAPEEGKTKLLKECNAAEYLSCLQNMDIATWLVDDVLCKVDRMSMLNSIEVRSPMLDHEFAELAFRIPANYRIRNGEKKYILKRAMQDTLPAKVLSHRKQGFGVPLKLWFRDDLRQYTNDRLNASNSRLGDYLNMDYVRKIVRDHDAGMRDLNQKIWTILVFDAWLEQFS